MSKLSDWERKARIRKGEPITVEFGDPKQSLTFYPLKMSNYEEFLSVKKAWTIRMTTLPVQYLSMPYLSALWAVDYDSVMATGKNTGLFERIIRFLCLSLRLGREGEEVQLKTPADDHRKLLSLILTIDGKPVKLTPKDFSIYVRPLVAEQNGLELPDESQNPELIGAEKALNEKEASKLKFDLGTLIASVAYLSHARERDIDDWTVLEFEKRKQAIDRDKMFTLYTQARLSGMVTFKGDPPYPSWCLEANSLTPALVPVSELQENLKGLGDVNKTIQQGMSRDIPQDI